MTPMGELRQKMEKVAPSIIKLVIEQAMAGDAVAQRLIVDKCMPNLKSVDREFTLELPAKASMSDAARAIFAAVAAGDVTTSQGSEMLQALASVASVVRVDEIAQRLDRLESVSTTKRLASR